MLLYGKEKQVTSKNTKQIGRNYLEHVSQIKKTNILNTKTLKSEDKRLKTP